MPNLRFLALKMPGWQPWPSPPNDSGVCLHFKSADSDRDDRYHEREREGRTGKGGKLVKEKNTVEN